jgi:hypothetical protein
MTQRELATLKPGDTVIHKPSGKVYTFDHVTKAWDMDLTNFSRSNERSLAVCIDPNEPTTFAGANYRYFQARHIKKGGA